MEHNRSYSEKELNLENLEEGQVRTLMNDEFEKDIAEGKVYHSPRLKANGHETFVRLMKEAIQSGNDNSFAEAIRSSNILEEMTPRRTPSGKMTMAKVPFDAHVTLAEGEFNRCYLRGICRKAIGTGSRIQVYRAKQVREPRPESEAMLGKIIDPNSLLSDLRNNVGIDTFLGLPPGPNSGLSGRLIK